MNITLVNRTDVGRVRTNNEDNFFADLAAGLFIVCDGMGGHNAGEVASKICCETIVREMNTLATLRDRYVASGKPADLKILRKGMENALSMACREIFRQASRSSEHAGMGTTCTAVLLASADKGILAHVGDSRLYVRRGKDLHQLSEDHTYVNELVRRGALTREQAKNHPQGNVLSRAMGVQASVSIDTMIFDIDPGDTYMLCSDGVYNYYNDPKEIADILGNDDLEKSLDTVIDRALERGGHDNCTAIVFRVGGEPHPVHEALAAQQRISILKKIPIFSHLTYNELVKVLGLTQLVRVKQGSLIITEGLPGDELFVVLSGEVEILKNGVAITRLGAGVHLGEMAMVDDSPRSASVNAITPVNLLSMRREEFFAIIRTEPAIATKLLWSFVKVLSGRLRNTNEALAKGGQDDQTKQEFKIFVDDDDK